MSSTFIERSPESDGDKSLILIMDGDGNVTADPAHFEKLINNQKIPDMGIKIVRLDSGPNENDSNADSDGKQELKLTVEEIYPEHLSLASGDQTVISSPLEILPGPSNEHISHDIVDPFSQMDSEQLERLEHALASEQAKQILGENVTAMLDMLTVDDSPAAFLQNSIKNDHCYTNLLPSSDPNGPSFFMNDNRTDTSRGKGKAKVGTPVKGRKVLPNAMGPSNNFVKKIIREGQPVSKQQATKQAVLSDYGVSIGGGSKAAEKTNNSKYEEDVDVEESEASVGEEEEDEEEEEEEEEDDDLSDEDYSDRATRGRRKPKKNKRRIFIKKQTGPKSFGRSVVGRPVGRVGRRSAATAEMRARNEKLNDAMSKIVQSMETDSKDSDTKADSKKGPKKIKTFKSKDKEAAVTESEKVKETEESPTPPKSQPAKYPKRENRKPPAHLADAFGPALFSTPDIIRRVSTGEEIPQTPSEKKNFTVGVHSKLTDNRGTSKPIANKVETSASDQHRIKSKPPSSKESIKIVKPNAEVNKIERGSLEDKMAPPKSDHSDKMSPNKAAYVEIQKLIEKQQVKPVAFEEDQDYSDENIDEIYLDPSQMDQSLLEGFSQAASKSEDQLLQEAILLQEQLIEANKGIVIPESGASDGNQVQMPFETETIENIQSEITSAILVAQQEPQHNSHEISSASESYATKKSSKTGGEIQSEDDGLEGGNLVVDEGKEDRRRNSAKRSAGFGRRSDEVSDLDSDMDDALSEASWNSEDDPDRLWCICRKPHNNRFMICCDVCEEWFHGKCVGITKTIGKQMEQDGLEWSCPNCTKKKKLEEQDKEAEKIKLLKEKMAQSIKEQQQKIKESQKLKNQTVSGKEKSIKSPKIKLILKQTKISDFSYNANQGSEEEDTVGRKCIMCKGPVRENSIYCSDDCIRKHSQHAISQLMADAGKKPESESSTNQGENSKLAQKITKDDPRVVVVDSECKKFLVGQSAPTIANLTTWLKENPSYHVVYKKSSDKREKILLTSRKVVKIQTGDTQKMLVQKPAEPVKSTQLKLSVSPNSKQINILQPGVPGGKKVIQIVNAAGRGTKQTAYVVKPKQTEIIDALPLPLKTVLPKGGVPVKVKEATSPKVVSVAANKDPIVQTQKPGDKVQRKKRERGIKSTETKMGTSGKVEENKEKDKEKEKDKDKEKEKEKKDADQQIRDSVKKTLADTLKARVQECTNMEFDEKHIEDLAVKIEEKLFKHFENKVDTKYKSKYRSLVFNIKDPKNETLFKKIVDNSISPKELVKLSPEELASQELARWREKENQHQLEMIKKTELELMTKGNTYIMKSHKGEQVIESDQSEKVAAVAAEIDPNTPAQELVSAINSVTSTTQDGKDDEEKNKNSETSFMRVKKKEKERRRSRDRKHERRSKDRRRSSSRSSRSRSHHSKGKRRSHSRDRYKERSKSRHRDKKVEKKKVKDAKEEEEEGEEVAEMKREENRLKNEISTSDITENTFAKKSVEEDEEDRVPSSTVIIKTPDINIEESELMFLWKGSIVMADVAKFSGIATEVSGDCSGLYIDIPEKVDVVGRIPFDTVWDYIARMKKMGTKDILVIKIMPVTEEEKVAYVTLYSYLFKRSRIGVIGKTSDAVKDFYLYPLASHSPLPQVLLPLDGPPFEVERENVILGIIVRNKHRSRHLGLENSQRAKKVPIIEEESSHASETVPDRSYTPPLPDKEQEELLKKVRQKRKIRVRMEYKSTSLNEEEEELRLEDDDSPYSPGDSDDDLPPLPKIAKPSIPGISASVSKLLSPSMSSSADSNLQDPVEIQKKIEEINRAIEEQTQQIQSLTSGVPKLASNAVLPSLPLLTTTTSSILTPPALSPSSFPVSSNTANSLSSAVAPSVKPQAPSAEKFQLPLISENDEMSSPTRSYTPPLKVEENIPFLPEVTSKISLPSNLQEILNSIQKKSEDSADAGMKDVTKTFVEESSNPENPNVKSSLNVLNQSKSILPDLSPDEKEEMAEESIPILSRLSDRELLEKAREMEMESELMHSINPCPPQPLPPGVHDIPLLPFTNPPPPPFFSQTSMEEKKPEKKMKLDPKFVFESEGVPDFNIPGSGWEDKRGAKPKSFKIDIKLGLNALDKKNIDVDYFDIESISQMEERHTASGSGSTSTAAAGKLEDDRMYPKTDDRFRSSIERDRRRSDDRNWKYDRRRWDDGRRYKDYRRHERRDRPQKFRFDHKTNRHLQKEWDGSIKNFEERQRWRNQETRREDARRAKKRADSSSN